MTEEPIIKPNRASEDGKSIIIELTLPIRIYNALKYICEIPPRENLHDYIVKALEMDAESLADSDFGNTIYYHSKKIKELLKE